MEDDLGAAGNVRGLCSLCVGPARRKFGLDFSFLGLTSFETPSAREWRSPLAISWADSALEDDLGAAGNVRGLCSLSVGPLRRKFGFDFSS